MNGFLKIYKDTNTLQDWQQKGHGYNPSFGVNYCPSYALLKFFFNTPQSLTISEFKARKIDTVDPNQKLITETITLDTALLVKQAGTYSDCWVYSAASDIVGLSQGYWDLYIKMSDDTIYISELIGIPGLADIISDTPDFNADFNQDFYI